MDFSLALLHPLLPDPVDSCAPDIFFFLLNYLPAYLLIHCSIWLVTKKENNACHMQQAFVYCLDKKLQLCNQRFCSDFALRGFCFPFYGR